MSTDVMSKRKRYSVEKIKLALDFDDYGSESEANEPDDSDKDPDYVVSSDSEVEMNSWK